MIKNNNLNAKPISIGNNNVLKVFKGVNLIWKKVTFKKIQGETWDKVRFNGNSKNKLPLNTKLKIITWNGTSRFLYSGRTIKLTTHTIILKNKYKEFIIESVSGGKVEYSIEENENAAIETCDILE